MANGSFPFIKKTAILQTTGFFGILQDIAVIYVDENMNYLEDKNSGYSQTQIESEKNILNKNLQEVRALYEIAKNEWTL